MVSLANMFQSCAKCDKNAGWGEVQKVDTSHLHTERERRQTPISIHITNIYIYILLTCLKLAQVGSQGAHA